MYNVLVADDEALEREALTYFISHSDLEIGEIYESSSGEDAVKQIMLHRPELILLDINMPGLNGLEVLAEIQKLENHYRVIFSTAYDYFEYAVEAMHLGAMEFLVKPVKREQLIGVLTHAIDELDDEAERDADSRQMKQTLELMGGKIVQDLVVGQLPEEDLYYLEQQLSVSYESRGNVYCASFLEECSSKERRDISENLKRELGYLNLSSLFCWRNTMLTILVFLEGGETKKCPLEMTEKVIASILKKKNTSFILGVGELFEDLNQIERSFARAREQIGDLGAGAGEQAEAGNMWVDMEKICQFLNENYSQKLSLEEIALKAGYSKYYINRLFKQYQGTTVMDYLIQIRIGEAKKLLKSSNYSVKRISMMVGYSEPNYFTLTFKKLEGISPMKYRYSEENT